MSGATLSIDAGTTLIKAVVFDETGAEVHVTRRPTAILSPRPGWSEQSMLEVRDSVLDCIAEAVALCGQPIARVAVTAQGDGAWMTDAEGTPARNAVLWNDARAVTIIDRWTRDGVLDEAFRINGSLGNLGLPHAILSWFQQNDASALTSVRDVTTCGSWLFESLTGARGLHPSDASAPWLDIRTGRYSDRLFELFGLDPIRDLIPPVLTDDELTQPLRADVSTRTGLPPRVPVTLAPYDVVATAAGGGSVVPGSAFCILGTTLCTGVLLDKPDPGGEPAGLTLLGGPERPVVRAFPTLAGTGVIEWLRLLLGADDAAAITALAAGSPPGARGVRVWPYLSPAGERAPFLDPSARGVIAGLSFGVGRADLARATVEGLAHVIRDCLAAAGPSPTELVVSGGGSASDLWCTLIADITGVVTVRVAGSQVGAKGAMLYAAAAAGEYAGLASAASALVTRAASFDPDPGQRDHANERHHDFLATRAVLAARWAGWDRDDAPGSQ